MPADVKRVDMRLIKISSLLKWEFVWVYEDVSNSPDDFIDIPYYTVTDETWKQTVILSWRWGSAKPESYTVGSSPMTPIQLTYLKEMLEALTSGDSGLVYLWVDWACVPQYAAEGQRTMVEVLRSKVYYASSRAMIVLPQFLQLSDLPGKELFAPLFKSILRELDRRAKSGSTACAMAHRAMTTAVSTGKVAKPGYFARVWTLAGEWFACYPCLLS
jgi:hypothetical protein